MRTPLLLLVSCSLFACGPGGRFSGGSFDGGDSPDYATPTTPPGSDLAQHGGGQAGCGELQGCYTVYAHADHVLYRVDLPNKMLITVGPFHAPMVKDNGGKLVEDTITDLAVRGDDKIFGISHGYLYTVDAGDGHVTQIGPVTACGTFAVALTFDPQGNLYAGDYNGAFCKIDAAKNPPKVTQITATLGGGLALAGDIVSVADGTMYGTAQLVADGSMGPTATNNYLVKLDPQSGRATIVGQTGFPKMFGISYAMGQVFGFTHDGSGEVVTIDPKTGKGTKYAVFTDSSSGKPMPISFAGAGVNAMVAPMIQ